jgi:hypothetical protein
VLEYYLKPGQKEPMHSHLPGIVYSFADAQIRTTLPDGSTSDTFRHAGDLHWREAVTHAAENIGTTEARFLAVELKRCE